jgi:NADH-quinone oxidoreductase subunit G
MTITSSTGSDVTPVETVTVTIDGVALEVPKGTLAIRAAELLGIEIPRFCDHPLLDPVAACRACLIEVEGMPKPQPACAQVVSDGMAIRTQQSSPVAREAQEGVMEFLLLNHPLDCPVCDKGGECPLQNQAMQVGRPTSRFEEAKRTFPKPINVSAQILLDRERCVSCARCTRFAEQIAGDPMLELLERGAQQQVGTASDEPFDSYFSGNTVQICPVGALTSASYRFRSRPFDLVSVPTTCEHCASGCSLRTDVRRGTITRRLAWEDPSVNEDWNCDKGRFAFGYMTTERITTPMVREDGVLRPASWPEAITVAARGLAAAGPATGVMVGGRATMEDAYGYARFARAILGTDSIDFRSRQSSAEEAGFLAARIAGSPVEVSYEALDRAPVVLLVCLEPEDESPIVFLRLRKASRSGRVSIVSMSAVRTRGMDKMKARWWAGKPGTEAQALRSLADGQVGEQGSLEADLLVGLRAPGAVILVGERAAGLPGTLTAVAALADATGASLAWVPRRAGERGALDAGALAGLLPGGRPLTDPDARAQVAAAWGIDPARLPSVAGSSGVTLLEEASQGRLQALLVAGIEPSDAPDPGLVRSAIASTPFVVSLEHHHSEVTQAADVVLPVAVVAEKAGTFLTWEGRPRPFGAAFRQDLAVSDLGVLAMIARELGQAFPADVPTARRELGSLGQWTGERASAPGVAAGSADEAVTVATWRQLLDAGAMQAGEPHLAATARPAVARMSGTTAARLLPAGAQTVVLSGPRGSVTLPVEIGEVCDQVVWIPLNSPGCQAYEDLGVAQGDPIAVTAGGAA